MGLKFCQTKVKISPFSLFFHQHAIDLNKFFSSNSVRSGNIFFNFLDNSRASSYPAIL